MDRRSRIRLSKRLSYHLRHDPAAAGVELDPAGWAPVQDLLEGLGSRGRPVTRAQLEEVVARSDKRRFELSADGRRIRARYGHSVEVDPGHAAATPPEILYHGTSRASLGRIRREGLKPMGRRQVHLSEGVADALRVGRRHGDPVVLEVDAAGLVADGAPPRPAAPGVWLVERVPPGRLGAVRPG